ncbi:MAG: acetylornithine deacetylase, partial [Myxococcales bacterium]
MSTSRELLRELVAIDSTSSRSNAPIIDAIAAILKPAGFALRRHEYLDDAGVPKVNLIATSGEGRPALALVGHSDCVPFDPAWDEALKLTERDGKLFARGAADTKSFIACALHAATRTQLGTLKKPLALVFTADEEVGCVGAKHLVDEAILSPELAIVGEPTALTPIRAHKGYALAEIEVRGKEGHSAYPATGRPAILKAAQLLTRIEDLARSLEKERDDDFDPPYTTLNVGLISGGKAKNIIPGLCRFTLEWRPIPGQPSERVLDVVKAAARSVSEEHDVEIVVNELRGDRGVDTPKDARLVKFLEAESGKRAATVPFGTEAPQLTDMGAQAVVFGPGDIRVAHRTGEFVPMEDLDR